MKRGWIVRLAALFASALLLAACSKSQAPWYGTDIRGVMPQLQFDMLRVNDGKEVTAQDYRGKVVLLYFGYTHCPDVCPTTLSNFAITFEALGNKAKDVRALFVTVDPNRDTPAVLKKYVAAFAPEIDGLRGSPDSLTSLARRYRVAFGVTPASPGHPYEVSHSSAVFIFDPKGHARLVTMSTENTKGLANDIERLLNE